ncbi:MAG: DsbA family protein [Hyphomicrobiaceae bacterium]
MTSDTPRKHLIYFGDPMCSWCYGFEPVLRALSNHFGDRLPIGIVVGGLRAGTQRAMTLTEKDEVRKHWDHVHEASGQPFDYAFFDRGRFVYDTEPACRAVVVVRRITPDGGLGYFADLQRAFYAKGQNITKPEILADIASHYGLTADEFLTAFDAPETREETIRDFLMAQENGIQGFPTLIAGSVTQGYQVICHGYRPIDGLIEGLELWLDGHVPDNDNVKPVRH